jgi:hypothetical protein
VPTIGGHPCSFRVGAENSEESVEKSVRTGSVGALDLCTATTGRRHTEEHTMSARHTHRSTIVRAARLAAAGTIGALGLTAGLAGTAGALTPQPDLPIVQAPQQPEPPVVIDDLAIPTEDPGPQGPEDLGVPPVVPDPFPVPPQHPEDLVAPTDDDEPGIPGPDDFTNGEEDDDPDLDGPDDFTNGEEDDDPDLDGPDDFTIGETTPTVPATTVPEVDDEVLEETATAADELAYTGGDLDLVTAAAALLGAGALAAGAATIARRRRADGSTDTAEVL